MNKYTIPSLVFLIGLGIALHYAYTTNYLAVYDASRDYWLYNYYRINPIWHPMSGLYGLQNTTILSTYLPALIQRIIPLSPESFFKWYIAIEIAFVPLIVYLIAMRFIGKGRALFASLYVMGWVAFYQGGSYGRLNFAVAIFGLFVLVMLSSWKYKTVTSVLLVSLLPFAHYGVVVITIIIFGGCILLFLWKRYWQKVVYVSLLLVVLISVTGYWQGVVNHDAWQNFSTLVNDVTLMAKQGVGADAILRDGQEAGSNSPLSLMSRDRITQAFFGISNPDNANVFQMNWWLLGFGWLTVMVMRYGAYVLWRGLYMIAYKGLVFWSFIAIILTILLPQLSRGYGIEKVYYQAIVVISPCLIIGGERIAKRLHIPTNVLLCLVLVPYVVLMWKYGIISSVTG